MRYRRRYIAFEIDGSGVGKGELRRAIERSFDDLPNLDRTALKLALYEKSSQRGLFRCGHRQVEELKALISGIRKIGDREVSLKILGVSGTIKTAKRKFSIISSPI